MLPGFDDLSDCLFDGDRNVPRGVVFAHLAQVAVIADVIADAWGIDVSMLLALAGDSFDDGKRLEDTAGISLAAAEVIDLAAARGIGKRLDEPRDVQAVDVVANLLAFVTEDLVLAALEVAAHQVAEKAVQFDAAVIGAGHATATQATRRHAEIPP